ncbi:MAG: NUDIX domain-containing protein [archaeon]
MESKAPEVTVGALVFNAAGKLFLVKSHKWRDKYAIPGGHIELGETAEEALKREIMEETGMNISGLEFIGFQEHVFDTAFWKKKHFIFLDFACKTDFPENGKIQLNDEGQSYIWVDAKEALKMDVEPYTKKTIENYLYIKGRKNL